MALVDPVTIVVNCSGPGSSILTAKTKINIAQLTAANFNSQNTAVDTLVTAYNDLTDGIVRDTLVGHVHSGSNTRPSGTANRGQKWILTAEGTNGRLYTYTIPAAPGGGAVQADGISADFTDASWTGFVSAFEGLAVDPFGGSLVLVSGKLGGRRR